MYRIKIIICVTLIMKLTGSSFSRFSYYCTDYRTFYTQITQKLAITFEIENETVNGFKTIRMAIFLSCYDLFRNIAIKCQAPLTFANNNGQIMKVKLLPSTIYRFDFYFILIRCALSRASNCVCKPTFYSSSYVSILILSNLSVSTSDLNLYIQIQFRFN